jgi:hypothetical protein
MFRKGIRTSGNHAGNIRKLTKLTSENTLSQGKKI